VSSEQWESHHIADPFQGTFARVWLSKLSATPNPNGTNGQPNQVFALKILRKVDSMLMCLDAPMHC
jgi:hypothetical protein